MAPVAATTVSADRRPSATSEVSASPRILQSMLIRLTVSPTPRSAYATSCRTALPNARSRTRWITRTPAISRMMLDVARAMAPVANTPSSSRATVPIPRLSGRRASSREKKSTSLPIMNGTLSDTPEATNRSPNASSRLRRSGITSAYSRRSGGKLAPPSPRRAAAMSRSVETMRERIGRAGFCCAPGSAGAPLRGALPALSAPRSAAGSGARGTELCSRTAPHAGGKKRSMPAAGAAPRSGAASAGTPATAARAEPTRATPAHAGALRTTARAHGASHICHAHSRVSRRGFATAARRATGRGHVAGYGPPHHACAR